MLNRLFKPHAMPLSGWLLVPLLLAGCGEQAGTEHATLQVPPQPVDGPMRPGLAAAGLQALFTELDYRWPPEGAVPRLLFTSLPPDLSRLTVGERKRLFFRVLLPIVLAENERVREQRQFLLACFAKPSALDAAHTARLERLLKDYRMQGDWHDPRYQQTLLARVDELPVALILAQAANESAWGTSRFAREANNIFGHWTYDPSIGIKPAQRESGARHYIRMFPDLRAAVRAYLRNINTNRAYRGLRSLRAGMRAKGAPLDPIELAGGLLLYSQRGTAYVRELRAMIRSNGLKALAGEHLVLAEGR